MSEPHRSSARRLVLATCAVAALALGLAPKTADAELSELGLSTLEYASEGGRHRDLSLKRRVATTAAPLESIREEAADREHPLDPRPGLAADAPLYRRLGLVAWDEAPDVMDWPIVPSMYFPGEDRIVVARGTRGAKRQGAHVLAVQLALLDHRTPLSDLVKGDNRDHEIARQAFVLGDAALVWLGRKSMPHGDDLPARQRWAEEQVGKLLPTKGADEGFGSRLARARLSAGLTGFVALRNTSPWGVVDELYQRGVPTTTSALLHPEQLMDPQPPRLIAGGPIPALGARGAPGAGVIGELRLRLWLEASLEDAVAERVTVGWTGDRYMLFPPTADDQPWTSTLVVMSTWSLSGGDPDAESQDFAGALVELVRARSGEAGARAMEGAPEGTQAFLDDHGLAVLIERREERVLYIEGCPADQVAAAREQVWTSWQVGTPSTGIEGPVAPPEAIAEEPPPVPWYRRTPGLVALGIWLLVILPLLGYAGAKGGGLNPVRIYLYGVAATIALIVVGWFLGL